jgi:hypothetical protein
LSAPKEFVIDGNEINKTLDAYKLEAYSPTLEMHHELMGQAFEIGEKQFIKTLVDRITKAQPDVVKFVNLETIATGPHKSYLAPICGALAELVQALEGTPPIPLWPNFIKLDKKYTVTGTIEDPWVLPWHLVAKIDKNFKGLLTPRYTPEQKPSTKKTPPKQSEKYPALSMK